MSGTLNIEQAEVTSEEFLILMKKYKHFRVKFETKDKEPFKYLYFKVDKKELQDVVRGNQFIVGYEIRFNSQVQKDMDDIVYIHTLKMTLLDKEKK